MDNHAAVPSETQQYQQYYQHYQQQQPPPHPHQPQPEATNPSAYDPSTQSYYASVQPYNPIPNPNPNPNPNPHQPQEAQPDYSSYYYPGYSNSYQPHVQTDSNSIHPPGVTIPTEMPQIHAQNHRDVYFRHWFENLQQQQQQQQQHQRQQIAYMAPGYPTTAVRGGRGGKPNRGGRHGISRGRGRGRGGTRGTVSVNHIPLGMPRQGPQPSSSAPGTTRMAWCEICKVDCNTPEVLEQHKNGKKHIKNLKVYEELQDCTKIQVELQTPQIQGPDSSLVAAEPETKEGGSAEKQPMVSDAVSGDSNGGVDIPKDTADKAMSCEAQTSQERVQIGGARGGIKRKMVRVGRGGKLIKVSNGSRKPAELVKPKKTLDLLCDLCNVKCESQVVFNSHMAGKKHLSNIKKLQGHHHAAVGNLAIPEALPSTLQALYPNAPSSTQESQQGAVQDPQSALVQLLNQHGIQDAQSLLSQIIPVLLTQVLPNVTSSAQLGSGLGNVSAEHISVGEKSESKMPVVEQSVQKTPESGDSGKCNIGSLELQRPNASTVQASVVDGREDNELVAGEQGPENSTNSSLSLI